MIIDIRRRGSAHRPQRRSLAFAALLAFLAAIFMQAGGAAAATLVVGFDERLLALREASGAADEARVMFLGLPQTEVQITQEGAIFTADYGLESRLADLFARAMPPDSRIVAVVRPDRSILVAYKPDLLRTNRPDIAAAIPYVRAKLTAMGAGDAAISIRDDGRLEVRTAGQIDVGAVKDQLNATIGLQLRVADCHSSIFNESCDLAGEQLIDPLANESLWVARYPIITSDMFEHWGMEKSAYLDGDELTWRLSPEGGRRFSAFTRNNIGVRMAIVYQGRILMAPVVAGVIDGGQGTISMGSGDEAVLKELLNSLQAYLPPLPFTVERLAD